MPSDPRARARPGEPLTIAAAAYNAWTDAATPKRRGDPLTQRRPTSVEIGIENKTGGDLDQFSIVKIGDPSFAYSDDSDRWKDKDVHEGDTPTATDAFAITMRPAADGEIVPARILGLARCQVNLTDTSHRYAAPTTETGYLTSGTTGPARILWIEEDFAATGTKWATVLLGDMSASSGSSTFSGARVSRGSYLVPYNTNDEVSFTTEEFDTDDYWDSGADTKFTIPATGYYLIGCSVAWFTNSSNTAKNVYLRVNGLTYVGMFGFLDESAYSPCAASTLLYLTEDDYVEVIAFTGQIGGTDVNDANFWIKREG